MSGPFGLLVLWLAAAIAVVGVDAEVCQLAPNWKVNGRSPMRALQGHVTVVALLQAS